MSDPILPRRIFFVESKTKSNGKSNILDDNLDITKYDTSAFVYHPTILPSMNWIDQVSGIGVPLPFAGENGFLSTAFQLLLHIAPVGNYLIEADHISQCPRWNRGEMCVFCIMTEFSHQSILRLEKHPKSKSAIPIKAVIGSLTSLWRGKRFRGADLLQEDIRDAIRFILTNIECVTLPVSVADGNSILPQKTDLSNVTSLPAQLFGLYIRESTECKECKFKLNKYIFQTDIVLPLGAASSTQHAFKNLFSTVKEIAEFDCPRCMIKRPGQQKFTLRTPPRVLIVSINRFSSGGNIFSSDSSNAISSKNKTSKPFELPGEFLDLSSYVCPEGLTNGLSASNWKFRLHAVGVHEGHSLKQGKFSLILRAPKSGLWHRIGDDEIKVCSDTILKSEQTKKNTCMLVLIQNEIPSLPPLCTNNYLSSINDCIPLGEETDVGVAVDDREVKAYSSATHNQSDKVMVPHDDRKIQAAADPVDEVFNQQDSTLNSTNNSRDNEMFLTNLFNQPLDPNRRNKAEIVRKAAEALEARRQAAIERAATAAVAWKPYEKDSIAFSSEDVGQAAKTRNVVVTGGWSDTEDESDDKRKSRLEMAQLAAEEMAQAMAPVIKKRDRQDIEYDFGKLKKKKAKVASAADPAFSVENILKKDKNLKIELGNAGVNLDNAFDVVKAKLNKGERFEKEKSRTVKGFNRGDRKEEKKGGKKFGGKGGNFKSFKKPFKK